MEAHIHGIELARKAPVISHLFFADDSLLFSRVNSIEANCILEIPHFKWLKMDKFEASFSQNVLDEDKEIICSKMCVMTVTCHSKYLGLQVIFGRSKKEIFELYVDRVWKKVKGWKEKFVSRSRKQARIKAILQAILSYIMSCYILSEGVRYEIEALHDKFWCGPKDGNSKIH